MAVQLHHVDARLAASGKPAYRPKYVQQAKQLCELGATDHELARFFRVSLRTIYRWQNKHPEFAEALKLGKETPDDRVERSLFHRAVGYTHKAEKIFCTKDGSIVRAPYLEHYPPDTAAAIFWLKNRRGWRDKVDLSNSDGTLAEALAEARKRSSDRAWLTENDAGSKAH